MYFPVAAPLLLQASSASQEMCTSFKFSLLNLAAEPKTGKLFTNTSENLAIYLNGKYKLGLVLRSGLKALHSFVT